MLQGYLNTIPGYARELRADGVSRAEAREKLRLKFVIDDDIKRKTVVKTIRKYVGKLWKDEKEDGEIDDEDEKDIN